MCKGPTWHRVTSAANTSPLGAMARPDRPVNVEARAAPLAAPTLPGWPARIEVMEAARAFEGGGRGAAGRVRQMWLHGHEGG